MQLTETQEKICIATLIFTIAVLLVTLGICICKNKFELLTITNPNISHKCPSGYKRTSFPINSRFACRKGIFNYKPAIMKPTKPPVKPPSNNPPIQPEPIQNPPPSGTQEITFNTNADLQKISEKYSRNIVTIPRTAYTEIMDHHPNFMIFTVKNSNNNLNFVFTSYNKRQENYSYVEYPILCNFKKDTFTLMFTQFYNVKKIILPIRSKNYEIKIRISNENIRITVDNEIKFDSIKSDYKSFAGKVDITNIFHIDFYSSNSGFRKLEIL